MGFKFRKRFKVGPVVLNFTERGMSSYSIKLGIFTWNPRRRRMTTNLPGGAYHTTKYGQEN